MSPNCTKTLLDVLRQSNAVAVFSRYKLVENIKKFDFENKPLQNLRVLKDPLQKLSYLVTLVRLLTFIVENN